jgi:type II secretory pathway pseudopilin PulG
MKNKLFKNNLGQGLVEIILAMGIFAIVAASIISLILGGNMAMESSQEQTEAEYLAQEAIEAVRSIREEAWNKIIFSETSVATSTEGWFFSSEGENEIIGDFTRTIKFFDVCRDVLDNITDCPGEYLDKHSKRVEVEVIWEVRPGVNNSVKRETYLTNWDSKDWIQTDWSSGAGQSIWSDDSAYESDDGNIDYLTPGEIKLRSIVGSGACGRKVWGFNVADNYLYDTNKIEINNSYAQLKAPEAQGYCAGTVSACDVFGDQSTCENQSGCLWGNGSSGGTVNSDFAVNADNWNFAQMNSNGVTVSGSYLGSGGNPDGYVDINIPGAFADSSGGYWEQEFSLDSDNPDTATLSFDWRILEYSDVLLDNFTLYVFVDSYSGAPSIGTELWSNSVNSTSAWESISNLDVSASLNSAGTYYVKVLAYRETNWWFWGSPGSNVAGFDNIDLSWEKAAPCLGTPTSCNFFTEELTCLSQANCSWNDGIMGSIDNSDFAENANNWLFNEPSGNGVSVSGSYFSSGGNPDGYVDINIPGAFADSSGGYWEQSFSLDSDNPDTATLSFDWRVLEYSDDFLDNFTLYVFVDSFAGAPSIGTELWSNSVNSTSAWESISNLDVSASLNSAGTYYVKFLAYRETNWWFGTPPGSNIAGFDNIELNWFTASTYPDDLPIVQPSVSYAVDNINQWGSFTEKATKNGGEIYYQLSIDDGGTWLYWNGSTWGIASIGDYNTANVIDANINSFPTTTQKITYRAFLESDGTQLVQLDSVSLACEQYKDWDFDVSQDYVYDSAQINIDESNAKLISVSGSCSGGATACLDYSDQTNCESQSGCTWDMADCSGTPNTCASLPSDTCGTCGCDFTPGVGGVCSNNGSCQDVDRNICDSTCGAFGCYRRGYCRGTLNCSLATDESTCSTCSSCLWVPNSGDCSGTPDLCSSYSDEASCDICGCVWDSADCSGTATLCDTYIDQANCESQSGCFWEGGLYSIEVPTIQPNSSYLVNNVNQWSGFTETATKDGGEIYYQLSSDDGDTWRYWDGLAWVLAGENDYNIASVVDANIINFATSSEQILFKAFLESDGTQQVKLDNVQIAWGEANEGQDNFVLSAYLVSSAFNMGTSSVVQILEWDETRVVNSSIKLQIRTAPDDGGAPGVWSDWYGENGANEYFISPESTLIPPELSVNTWLQYRVELSGDGSDTPVLREIRLNYK